MALVVNGDGNITGLTAGGLPDASITQADLAANIAGNGPAFFASRSADQSITQSSYTRINFDSESFDTNSNYDNATNYRFTPTVAGYYLLFASLLNNPAGSGQYVTAIRKNGSNLSPNGNLVNTAVGGGSTVPATNLVYANGTTDYFDVAAYASTASPTVQGGSTFFGYMVRAA